MYVDRAGSRNRVDDCPRCGFKYFDKEPDFDDNIGRKIAISLAGGQP